MSRPGFILGAVYYSRIVWACLVHILLKCSNKDCIVKLGIGLLEYLSVVQIDRHSSLAPPTGRDSSAGHHAAAVAPPP